MIDSIRTQGVAAAQPSTLTSGGTADLASRALRGIVQISYADPLIKGEARRLALGATPGAEGLPLREIAKATAAEVRDPVARGQVERAALDFAREAKCVVVGFIHHPAEQLTKLLNDAVTVGERAAAAAPASLSDIDRAVIALETAGKAIEPLAAALPHLDIASLFAQPNSLKG